MAENSVGVGVVASLSSGKARAIDDFVIRISDVILCVLALIFFFPSFVVLGMIIRLETPGKVLFKQRRVGLKGRIFEMYKFRSMCQDADKRLCKYRVNDKGITEPITRFRDDSRVTRVGKYIRKCGIDELPQLINVIKGDMSLVGPRPHPLEEVKLYSAYHKQRFTIKPGITGLSQISGDFDMPFDRIVEYDIEYIQNRSTKLYYKTIFRTIPFLFTDNGNF